MGETRSNMDLPNLDVFAAKTRIRIMYVLRTLHAEDNDLLRDSLVDLIINIPISISISMTSRRAVQRCF